LVLVSGYGKVVYANTTSTAINTPSAIHVSRESNTSLTLKWKKASEADGYQVFRYDKEKKKYVRVKTLSGASTKWTDRKLKKNRKYSYKVRAFENEGDKRVYSKFTYTVSSMTYSKNSRKVNAAGVKSKDVIKIALAGKAEIKASPIPSKYGTAKKKTVFDEDIRIVLQNKSFLSKDKKGNIQGKKARTTNIYLVAHNGNMKKVKVNIIDYVHPKAWMNLDAVKPEIQTILLDYQSDLTKIAYLCASKRSYNGAELTIDKDGKLINEYGILLNELEPIAEKFLVESGGGIITVNEKSVEFCFVLDGGYVASIWYIYDDNYSENEAKEEGMTKVADHWVYKGFIPF
jgi:hypothetical protein